MRIDPSTKNSLTSPAPNHPPQSWKGFEKLDSLNQMNSELFGRRGIVLRNISNNFVEILLGFGS
jgi:hypothetical protein